MNRSSEPQLPTWTAPGNWEEVAPGQMVLARFRSTGKDDQSAEVTVSALSGDGGGLLDNVNRWRRQIGLGPAEEADLAHLVTQLDGRGGRFMLVDMSGSDPAGGKEIRMIGAVQPRSHRTWFYKFMGDPEVVAEDRDAFVRFVQGVQYTDG